MNAMNGVFIVSLDYELFWGMQDVSSIDEYGDNILGTYTAIPKLLDLFEQYDIRSTWAVVGMMYAKSASELADYIPNDLPTYVKPKVSTYRCLPEIIKMNGEYDKYFFAPNIIDAINSYKGTEIASHSFSHYYCDEPGQNIDQFNADLVCDKRIRKQLVSSFVFPRNHSLSDYVEVLKKNGIFVYRGVETNWVYNLKPKFLMRLIRLVDAYIPLTNSNEYIPCWDDGAINLRGSRFFRPYTEKSRFLERLKIRRIKRQMLNAARNGKVFHLWFHPHNIGIHQEKNLDQLKEIFAYYSYLKKKYKMKSMTMEEAADFFME